MIARHIKAPRLKLTSKQDTFCRNYVNNGGNASAAYRAAYNLTITRDQTVWTEACELLNLPKVARRIAELAQRRAALADLDDALVVHKLAREADRADSGSTGSSRVRAIELLGKIARLPGLVEQKIEVSGTLNQQHLGAFAELSVEELRGLLGQARELTEGDDSEGQP